MRDDLNAIPVFVTVVESGNFASAAAILHVTRSAVGKTIARLEARLGVALFQRTTRRQLLTEEGEQFYPALWAAFAGSPARHRTIFGNMACRRHRRRSLSTGLCIISPVRRGGPMSSASFAMARPFLYPSAATPR